MDGERRRVLDTGKGVRPLTRREALRIGLAGSALAWLGRSCQQNPDQPNPPEPPDSSPVYELAPGSSLYDDFDGHGNLQTYDGRDLATAGALNPKLWFHDDASRVVDAALAPAPVPNYVIGITCEVGVTAFTWFGNPMVIEFADFGSLSADVMLSSRSTASNPSVTLNYHTTIPEQPPGRSWWVSLGILRDAAEPGGAFVLGQYINYNLGIIQNDYLGPAALDEWRRLRLDILTKADDPALGDEDLRLDYYLDGALKASRIPEDSAILIDPERTGLGPHRSLIVNREGNSAGQAIGYFDNIRAVYSNRIA